MRALLVGPGEQRQSQAVLRRFPGLGWVTGRKQHFLERENVSQFAPLALRLKLV